MSPGPGSLKKDKGGKGFYSHFIGELDVDENGLNYTADDDAVDAAIERLRNPVNDKPLCIFWGLFYPHVPYGVEEPYFSAIDRTKLPKRIDLSECKDKAPILTAIFSLVTTVISVVTTHWCKSLKIHLRTAWCEYHF